MHRVDANAPGDELSYPEFLEALVAFSAFRYPDPYTPLDEKFVTFVEEDFFAALRKKVQMGMKSQDSAIRNLIW